MKQLQTVQQKLVTGEQATPPRRSRKRANGISPAWLWQPSNKGLRQKKWGGAPLGKEGLHFVNLNWQQ